jgi:hypothetical protein
VSRLACARTDGAGNDFSWSHLQRHFLESLAIAQAGFAVVGVDGPILSLVEETVKARHVYGTEQDAIAKRR